MSGTASGTTQPSTQRYNTVTRTRSLWEEDSSSLDTDITWSTTVGPSPKRRKVSWQKYDPVWIKVESKDHWVKTHSVVTQHKPYPKEQSFVKWTDLVKKIELRNRHVDVYQQKWLTVTEEEFESSVCEFRDSKYRLVDEDGDSWGAVTLRRILSDTEIAQDIPEEVGSHAVIEEGGYISDLE
jgi:hypothetical protein